MKPIRLAVDESILAQLDNVTKELGISRSAFMRDALNQALRQHRIRLLERQQEEGYARYPVQPGEFDVWEDEQAWATA